jgi:hypothetical protein
MIATAPAVDAEMPTFDQGEMADRPKPAPKASKIKYEADATIAPPITAPQETPDPCASRFGLGAPVYDSA